MREGFRTFLKNAHKVESIERIRFIGPGVALVDGRFAFSGTEIKPDPKGLDTVVLVKEKGRWVITALRTAIPAINTGGPQ